MNFQALWIIFGASILLSFGAGHAHECQARCVDGKIKWKQPECPNEPRPCATTPRSTGSPVTPTAPPLCEEKCEITFESTGCPSEEGLAAYEPAVTSAWGSLTGEFTGSSVKVNSVTCTESPPSSRKRQATKEKIIIGVIIFLTCATAFRKKRQTNEEEPMKIDTNVGEGTIVCGDPDKDCIKHGGVCVHQKSTVHALQRGTCNRYGQYKDQYKCGEGKKCCFMDGNCRANGGYCYHKKYCTGEKSYIKPEYGCPGDHNIVCCVSVDKDGDCHKIEGAVCKTVSDGSCPYGTFDAAKCGYTASRPLQCCVPNKK